jgi:hypothetical protein
MPIEDATKALLRVCPLPSGEVCLLQSKSQLSEEIFRRQVTLKSVPLRSIRVRNDNRGSPLGTEALKTRRILLDVNFDWDKALVHHGAYTRVRVYLGIQPSACPSHWRGTKIEQYRASALLRAAKSLVDISFPLYGHRVSPKATACLFSDVRRIAF